MKTPYRKADAMAAHGGGRAEAADHVSQRRGLPATAIDENRASTSTLQRFQLMENASPQALGLQRYADMAASSPAAMTLRHRQHDASHPVQLMSFARFSGLGVLSNWGYNSEELALNALEAQAVSAVNKVHDLLHKRYGLMQDGLMVPHSDYKTRLTALVAELETVRGKTFESKNYPKAKEFLDDVIADANGFWTELQEYESVRQQRAADNKARAAEVVPHAMTDLPREQLWRMYIDLALHRDALKENPLDPGRLFDSQTSKGYQASMVTAFDAVFGTQAATRDEEMKQDHPDNASELDYEGYTALHEAVIQHAEGKENMRRKGGRDEHSQFSIPKLPENGLARRERIAALSEVEKTTVDGKPLATELVEGRVLRDQADAVTVHSEDSSKGHIDTRYAAAEGKPLVNAILKLYYDGKHKKQEADDKLKRIVATIRSLHVGHFFGDANGRLHMFVMLNKFLVEEGFSPAILPHGPEVFGGLKTVDGLVDDVIEGMRMFHELVQAHRLTADASLPQ